MATVAEHRVLDWFGCAIAGLLEPGTKLIRDQLGPSCGPCRILGTTATTSARDAATINATAGHALDYDDTHSLLFGHTAR